MNKDTRPIGIAFRYLQRRVRGKRLLIISFAVALMILAGWLQNLPALLLGQVVDKVIAKPADIFEEIWPSLAIISLAIVGREILSWVRKYIVENTATAIERDEFVGIAKHLLNVDLLHLIDDRVGALNVRIHRSIEGVVRLLKLVFLDLLPVLAVAVVAFVMAIRVHWSIGLVMVLVSAIGTGITLWQVRSQKGIRIDLFRAKEDIGANMTELLLGLEFVRASGSIKHELRKNEKVAELLQRKEFAHHRYMMSFDAVKQLVEGMGLVAVVAIGAWLATTGNISGGDVLTFSILYGSVAAPIRQLHKIIDEGFEATLMVADLEELYLRPIDLGMAGEVHPQAITGSEPVVSCKNLCVSYVGENAQIQNILRGINIDIYPGEVVGVVGPSGSGKSTLAKLMAGLISTYTGNALVFGVEVRDVDKESLSQLIAYAPQTPFIVKGTVLDNVVYGTNVSYTEADVWSALSEAQLADAIRCHPDALNRKIAEQGRDLSGGERQRLALTRVFLNRAQLVILDEATSSLDSINESLVDEAVGRALRGKTGIVIAHRLATIRRCNRILILEGGRIVDSGRYPDLMNRSTVFRTLVQREGRGELPIPSVHDFVNEVTIK